MCVQGCVYDLISVAVCEVGQDNGIPVLRLIFNPVHPGYRAKMLALNYCDQIRLIGLRQNNYFKRDVNEICCENVDLIELSNYMVQGQALYCQEGKFLFMFLGDKLQQKQNFITLKMPRNWRCMVLTCIQQKTQKVLISCWVFVPLVYLCIGTGQFPVVL